MVGEIPVNLNNLFKNAFIYFVHFISLQRFILLVRKMFKLNFLFQKRWTTLMQKLFIEIIYIFCVFKGISHMCSLIYPNNVGNNTLRKNNIIVQMQFFGWSTLRCITIKRGLNHQQQHVSSINNHGSSLRKSKSIKKTLFHYGMNLIWISG